MESKEIPDDVNCVEGKEQRDKNTEQKDENVSGKKRPLADEEEEERQPEKRSKTEDEEPDMNTDKKPEVGEKKVEDDEKVKERTSEQNGNEEKSGKIEVGDDEDKSVEKVVKEKEKDTNKQTTSDEPVDLDVKNVDRADVDNNGKSDEGSIHSEDSEKENRNVDMPMDLSTKSSKSSTPAQDIIMLSDESDIDELGLRRNGQKKVHLDEVRMRQKMIKRLQAELRNEEAKLVLLKKLRVSQMSHQMQNNISGKQQSSQHQSQPPPLVRGQTSQQQVKPAHSQPPQMSRPGSTPTQNGSKSQGPPPLVMAPRMDQRQLIQNQMKLLQQQQQQQQLSSTNRPSSNNFRGSQSQSEALKQIQQAQNRVPEETPAQRQAAAKLALRKQLEKTLLQIPPPKPPPPEMNFIPNLASPDFVYLLGLEEAVNHIIDTNLILKGRKNPDEKMVCNPFTCVQCGTDFTPVWKREKPGSKNVICEQCVTTNQKKALKQEHTNRLKSAFVKALQQEQEIERMQSQEAKTSSSSSSSSFSSSKEKSESRERESSRESPVTASRNASQAYKESMAETIRQHHNLLQAHQAAALRMGQPLGMQGFNPRAPFPYQLPFAARASDLQRQYLLDMIPKGGLPWTS